MREAVFAGEVLDQQSSASRLSLFVWIGIIAIALFLMGLILAAPVAAARGDAQIASSIYSGFSYLCHQIPERSFHLAGHKFAVCSRCTGLYAGFAVAALAYPLTRSLNQTETPSRLWLILAALPLAIDFGLGYFDVWHNTHASRFTTGVLLSSVAAFYIVPGMIELSFSVARGLKRSGPRRKRFL
jgi:uncharacterized membrane protein